MVVMGSTRGAATSSGQSSQETDALSLPSPIYGTVQPEDKRRALRIAAENVPGVTPISEQQRTCDLDVFAMHSDEKGPHIECGPSPGGNAYAAALPDNYPKCRTDIA